MTYYGVYVLLIMISMAHVIIHITNSIMAPKLKGRWVD